MKFLDSFLEEISGTSKESFCSFYNCPFLLSKSIEEMPQGSETMEEDTEEDLGHTEIMESVGPLKFDTDKIKIEEVLSIQDNPTDVWVIPLRKKKGDPFGKQMITIGRTMNNDICLPFKGISKFHAYLLVEGLHTYLVDGGSTNGTFLNGKSLVAAEKYELKDMDTISFARIFHYFYFTPPRLYDYLKFKKMI